MKLFSGHDDNLDVFFTFYNFELVAVWPLQALPFVKLDIQSSFCLIL